MQIPGSPDPASRTGYVRFVSSAVHDPGAGWEVRFAAIFGGQALSQLGSALTQFVLLWWIADTVGSVSALATAGFAALLPNALLSPLGGAFADRYSRRVLMIASDLINAACMAVLIWLFLSERIQLWHVYTLLVVRSALHAFQAPAAGASLSMLVPRAFLPRAAGLNQTLQSLTIVASAPLGALAASVMPLGWALSIDVVTAALAIVPLLIFRIPGVRVGTNSGRSVWNEILEGLLLIWRNPGLRHLYALLGAVALVIMPAFTLAPLLVKEHFSGGAADVALMEGLAGIGMVVGGMLVTVLAPPRQVPWILWSFAASCAALALTGLVPRNLFGVAVAWWVISGLTFVLGDAPLTALLQTTIPNHLQGRALASLNMLMGLAAPVGLALLTPVGELIGVRWLFVLMGVLGVLVSLAGWMAPALLNLDAGLLPGTTSATHLHADRRVAR